jgi:serine/threonine-protein kinase
MRIIADTPRPITDLRKSVPPHVAAALVHALEKLPADRFATAREFSDALQGRGFQSTMVASSIGPAAVSARHLMRHPVVLGLSVALLAALAVAATQWSAAHRQAPTPVVRFEIEMPATMLVGNVGNGTNLAISPDGMAIAYASDRGSGTGSIYVRRLDELEPRMLAGTDGAQQPTFSPDGQWIAYIVRDLIWRVQVRGDAPVQVGSIDAAPVGISWSPSGFILAGTAMGLVALPAAGGLPRVVAATDSANGELYFNQPRALPDGETVLFAIQPTGGVIRSTLATASLKTGRITRYDLSLQDPLSVVDGTLVYVIPNGALMGVRIDLDAGRLLGDPVALGAVITTEITGASQAALSPAGTLVYVPPSSGAFLGWFDPADGSFEPIGPETPTAISYPRLSPDGRRVAASVTSAGRTDIWVYDMVSRTPTRLTTTSSINERPEWSPDGTRVLYRGDRGTRSAIWWQHVDLSEPAEPLLASDAHDYYEGVLTPNGNALVYQLDDAGVNQADVWYRHLGDDTTARPIAATNFAEAQARISPDGRWVAYVTDASGASQVVVQPFPGPGGRVQISSAGGSEPVWSRDGRRIFYRDGRHLLAASIATTPEFAVTGRTELFPDTFLFAQAPHANYDVSLDGRRFLMVKGATTPQLNVTLGWLTEFRERMPGRK